MNRKQVSIDVTQEDRLSYKFVFKVKVMRSYDKGESSSPFFINVICDTFDMQEVIRKVNLLSSDLGSISILSIVYDENESQYIY